MKKLFIAVGFSLGMAIAAHAACVLGAYCNDSNGAQINGGLGIAAQPSATLQTTTPLYVGELVECNNCAVVLCVSTGTTTGGWSSAVSTTTNCR